MKIRVWEKKDYSWILKINLEFDYKNPDNFILDCIKKWNIIISEINEEIIGFLLYQKIWWNTPFLALIKITKKYQKKWIWLNLVKEFEKEILNKWYKSYITSTELKNTNSEKFFDKIGLCFIWELNMNHWKEIFYKKVFL